MPDQAEKLRRMVADDAPQAPAPGTAPPMIAITGGRGGVGATTVAMNLAAALADGGHRVVLVDAARHQADLAELAGIHFCGGGTLSDVLAERMSAAEALLPGPVGTLLLADRCGARPHGSFSSTAQQRLLNELPLLGEVADVIVIDIGSGISQWTQRFWQDARLIIVTAACDDLGVMDAYATIKLGTVAATNADIRVLFNQCTYDRAVAEAEQRLTTACYRFLGRKVAALPSLPLHAAQHSEELPASSPRVWEAPASPFGHAVLWLGSAVSQLIERNSLRIACATACGAPDGALAE